MTDTPAPPTESTGGTSVGETGGGKKRGDGQRPGLDPKKLHPAILKAFEQIDGLVQQRAGLNADIKAVREGLVARGLNKQALKDAERYHKMTEDQRTGYDATLVLARAALGAPLQVDAFADLPSDGLVTPETGKKPSTRQPAKKKGAPAGTVAQAPAATH